MSKIAILLGVACSILVIAIVYLIYLNVTLNRERIEPDQCQISKGEFGVTLGTSYRNGDDLAVLKKCGPSGNSDCSFDVEGVNDALTKCNSFAHICEAMVLSSNGKKAYIVDTNANKTTDPSFDMFEPHL